MDTVTVDLVTYPLGDRVCLDSRDDENYEARLVDIFSLTLEQFRDMFVSSHYLVAYVKDKGLSSPSPVEYILIADDDEIRQPWAT